MKTLLFFSSALVLAGLADRALADDIRPGLWKIAVTAAVAASPDWKPEPFDLTQCLTEADARNPAQVMLGMGSPGATGCDFPSRQYAGNSLVFEVSCAGSLGIKGSGQVSYSATQLDGTLNVNFGGDEAVAMQSKIHAIYLGACPAGGGGL
ncbi:MAG: DUF3617 domain-containing protein [Candidatus Methylumidiphilus sp.]